LHCLWVVPKPLFPIQDGARKANNALLDPIRKYFTQLDILFFDDQLENQDLNPYIEQFKANQIHVLRHYQTNIKLLKICTTILSFIIAPRTALTASNFKSRKNISMVKSILLKNNYDVIIFDGLHPYICFENLDLGKKKIIYRAHNVEHQLWSSAAERTSSLIWKKFLLWQGRAMAYLETLLLKRSSKVWAISQDDLNEFSKIISTEKCLLVGAGMDFNDRVKRQLPSEEKVQLMFLGKLDWAPNTDGLNWFLKEIWPELVPGRFHLNIVGGGHFQCSLQCLEDKSITFHGFVKDLNPFFSESHLGIVPIRFGSGTRIKVIECVSKGLPLMSTSMGVQGSGLTLNDYFHADSSQEWIYKLNHLDVKLLEQKSISAYQCLLSLYDKDTLAKFAFDSI